ncbi:MAG: transglutaminase domain-containing protein [Planctomycetes bacterium]|nr:transglutaminase domain-containing protein [Planctomycetota bacterium]
MVHFHDAVRCCFTALMLAGMLAPTASAAPASKKQNIPPALRPRETWDAIYLQGGKVGFARTTLSRVKEGGRLLVKIDGELQMSLRRFGQVSSQRMTYTVFETADGKVVRFEGSAKLGTVPMTARGRVEGDKMVIILTTKGKTQTVSLPWKEEYGGFFAEEQSLLKRPMKPGERRTLKNLAPIFYQVVTTELVAKQYEKTRTLNGTVELLRIEATTKLPTGGQIQTTIQTTMWTDRTGATVKISMAALKQESFRTSRQIARAEVKGGKLIDFGIDNTVKLARPIRRPHETRRVRYRVHLEGGDPAAAFISGPSQQVKSIDKNTAEVTVIALRPDDKAVEKDRDDAPSDGDRKPNGLIQSDDRRVRALAAKVLPDEKDTWTLAVALERSVHRAITEKNFSQAFSTAAEVAESLEGDCTEHAVLLAAMARARGIPARVVMGLVYMEGRQSLGYHMWNEVYVGGRWTALDATLGRGGIGGGHLKLATSNLKGASALSSFLPVATVLGRLKIEVIEAE